MSDIIANVFTIESLFTLMMLILLQAVLGFDNLLYIAIESNKVGNEKDAKKVRTWGIMLAVFFRIVLLGIIVYFITKLSDSLFEVDFGKTFFADFNLQSLVTLGGGIFIVYMAIKEINHLLVVDHIEHSEGSKQRSVAGAIALIVVMNIVFSFDSILSAMAIASETAADGTKSYQVELMVIAIVLSGIAMIVMADAVTSFLKKNRMYQVLGLFILFLVGVLLVTEGAHLAKMQIFGFHIDAMSKSSFYLVIFVLIVTDILSNRYQKRLWAQREAELLADNRGGEAGLAAVNKAMGNKGA